MEEYNSAIDLASKIKRAKAEVEKWRDHYAKPHYDTYKKIREAFRPYIDTLGLKEEQLKKMMTSFIVIEKKRKDEEQKALEEAALAQAKEGEDVIVPVVNDINTVEAVHGKATVRKTKKWRVKDFNKIPREYLMVNDNAVKLAMKKEKEVPGIEFYEEESIAISA